MQYYLNEDQQAAILADWKEAEKSLTVGEFLAKKTVQPLLKKMLRGGHAIEAVTAVFLKRDISVPSEDIATYLQPKSGGKKRRKREIPSGLRAVSLMIGQAAEIEKELEKMAETPQGLSPKEFLAIPTVYFQIETLLNLGHDWESVKELYDKHAPKPLSADTLRKYYQEVTREKLVAEGKDPDGDERPTIPDLNPDAEIEESLNPDAEIDDEDIL